MTYEEIKAHLEHIEEMLSEIETKIENITEE